jgi:hypothetical protein
MIASEPKYPWPTGCQACCSGEPFPSEEQLSVSSVA